MFAEGGGRGGGGGGGVQWEHSPEIGKNKINDKDKCKVS